MASFEIQFDEKTVTGQLRQLIWQASPQGIAEALAEIGERLTESTKQRFTTSTAPDGARWSPNADATLRRMLHSSKKNFTKKGAMSQRGRKLLASKKPLVASGVLADTIFHQLADSGTAVEVGTNRFNGEWDGGAAVHQFGSRDGRIPARPFLGLSAQDREDILGILQSHFRNL